jgi:translation initiation factor IF-1
MDPDGTRSPGGRAQVAGVVTETLPSAMYKVRLDEGSLVLAHIADRIDRNFVRLLVGDRVRLELSPVDVGRGRIVEKL